VAGIGIYNHCFLMMSENSSCLLVSSSFRHQNKAQEIFVESEKCMEVWMYMPSGQFICKVEYNLLLDPAVPFPSRTWAEE
jgi:hypothetical protein